MANYRDYPMSMWAFRNAGAVLNTVMIPREGDIRALPGPLRPEIGERRFTDPQGRELSFDALFQANYADGVLVMQGSRLLHEAYFHEFNEAQSSHMVFHDQVSGQYRIRPVGCGGQGGPGCVTGQIHPRVEGQRF